MKILFSVLFLSLLPLLLRAGDDSSFVRSPYKGIMERRYPGLKFTEVDNDSIQFLDYSGNWDFDGDGKKDSLVFIGNGGAHLYYHPRLLLTSDHKVRDYTYLNFDMPGLCSPADINSALNEGTVYPQFVVHDFDGDGISDIYLNYDIKYATVPPKLRRSSSSRHILLKYRNGDMRMSNYSRAFTK